MGPNPTDVIAKKFEDATRNKPSYACIFCDEVPKGPHKTWLHAKDRHKELLGEFGTAAEEEHFRSRFLKDALAMAYVSMSLVSLPQLSTFSAIGQSRTSRI